MQINTNNNQGGWGRSRVERGGRNRPPEAQQVPEAGRAALAQGLQSTIKPRPKWWVPAERGWVPTPSLKH